MRKPFNPLIHVLQHLLLSVATFLSSLGDRLTRRAMNLTSEDVVGKFQSLKASLSAEALWEEHPGLCRLMLKAGYMNEVPVIPYTVLEACHTVSFQPQPISKLAGYVGFVRREDVESGQVILCKDRPTRPGQGGTVAQTIAHHLHWLVPMDDLFHEDHWAVRNAISLLMPDPTSEDGQGTVSYVAKAEEAQIAVTDEMTLEWRGHRVSIGQGFVPIFDLGADAQIRRMVVAGKVEHIDACYMADCWMDWDPDGPNLIKDEDFIVLSQRIAMTVLSLQQKPLEMLLPWAVNSDWRFLPTTGDTCMLLLNSHGRRLSFVEGTVLLHVAEEHRQGNLTPGILWELMSPVLALLADDVGRKDAEEKAYQKAVSMPSRVVAHTAETLLDEEEPIPY